MRYVSLLGEADYRFAIDELLRRAEQQIDIFDRDLVAMGLEDTPKRQALLDLLNRSPSTQVRMVIRDVETLQSTSPRLLKLMALHAQQIELRISPENLHHLADAHVLIDSHSCVRRFHADQPRSALVIDDPEYVAPWQQRFDELWHLATPWYPESISGL